MSVWTCIYSTETWNSAEGPCRRVRGGDPIPMPAGIGFVFANRPRGIYNLHVGCANTGDLRYFKSLGGQPKREACRRTWESNPRPTGLKASTLTPKPNWLTCWILSSLSIYSINLNFFGVNFSQICYHFCTAMIKFKIISLLTEELYCNCTSLHLFHIWPCDYKTCLLLRKSVLGRQTRPMPQCQLVLSASAVCCSELKTNHRILCGWKQTAKNTETI